MPPEILATAPLQLEPLLPDPAQVRLKLAVPGSDVAAGPFTERKGAAVDLRAGIVDALTQLTLDEFRGLFEAMFSEGQLLFTGSVSFQLGNVGEEIPFQLRIYDTAQPLASWTQSTSGDTTTVTVTNPIESTLRIRRVSGTVVDGAGPASRPLDPIDGALPIDIPPSGTARFRLSGDAGKTLAGLDLSDMQTGTRHVTSSSILSSTRPHAPNTCGRSRSRLFRRRSPLAPTPLNSRCCRSSSTSKMAPRWSSRRTSLKCRPLFPCRSSASSSGPSCVRRIDTRSRW